MWSVKTENYTLNTDFNPYGLQLKENARTASATLPAVTRNGPGEE